MNQNHGLIFYIISDSVGQTSKRLIESALSQFPHLHTTIKSFPYVQDEKRLYDVLEAANEERAYVISSLVVGDLSKQAEMYSYYHGLFCYSILDPLVQEITYQTGAQPIRRPGAIHDLDESYFSRIQAIEFAVQNDDGKNPKGFLDADILILGISRTSKTPLSIYLANESFKVANLPLIPESRIPEQLYHVNPDRIFGLTNNPEVLNAIRQERMRSYGLNPDTHYSNLDRVQRELDYAFNLYEDLGCEIINVADSSIEETAQKIIQTLKEKGLA